MNERLLSALAASTILGISDQTVRNLVRRGRLPSINMGSRSLRIPASAIEALLAQKHKKK